MLKLVRYLKPYWWMVLLTIALLFVQANAELALPDYLSRIVNTGIQQGGIESAVPEAVRQSEMSRAFIFMSEEEQAYVLARYRLVDSASADYADMVERYPALAEQPVYVLNAVGQADTAALNPIMGKALLSVYTLEQIAADPAKAQELGSSSGFDLSQLPAGTDLFSLLAKLPAEQLAQIKTTISGKLDALGDKVLVQSAAPAVKAEYDALGMDTAKMQMNYILRTGGLMLLLTLASVVCSIAVGYLSARTGAGSARDMRRDVFARVEQFSSVEFDRFSTASLITRTTNDITQIQMVVIMLMRMVFYAPIMGVGGIIRASAKATGMWWLIAAAVGALIGLVAVIFLVSLPKFRVIQKLIDRLNLVTRENLAGMMVIRAFNMQGFEEKRFDKANRDLTSTNLFVNRVMSGMMPVMMLIMNILTIGIMWVGAHQVANLQMQVGDLLAFIQYAMQIVSSFLMLSMMFIILPRASVSGGRIAEVLDTKPVIVDPPAPRELPQPVRGDIEFRHMSFRYHGGEEDALSDISFYAHAGQTTAIIGPTGCGKSTIVNLIPRFYEVSQGGIYLDGVDIRELRQADLRDQIGFIPQKSVLFSGTIASNLRFADGNATDETLHAAAEAAQATEFIDAKPEGMEAEIAQGGANVSGGQKQRLAIARALVKKPPVLIFDDSFSALDFRTDAALRRALKSYAAGSTLFIVTQRISTVMNAEQIIVLDEGRMVGKGTHRELMQTCETYRDIALSQLSKEELE